MSGTGPAILVLGRSGQVARCLVDLGEGRNLTVLGREACDLSDPVAAREAVLRLAPAAVINAAAYTAVDAAETDAEAALKLNATGPAAAAAAAAEVGAPFIHLSTDYVFDGTKDGRYTETDPTAPLNVYGRTKLAGEEAILAAHPDALVLRTSWVVSPYGRNFVRTMLTLAATRDALSVVDDQIGAPTSAHDIARACLALADAKGSGAPGAGVFHMTAAGETSWRGFAEAIFARTAAWRGGRVPQVTPIPSSAYPTPARRPLNSRLDCSRLGAEFGVRLPDWQVGLASILQALAPEFDQERAH